MSEFKVVNAEPLPTEEIVRRRKYLPSNFKLVAPSTNEKEELMELLADADFLVLSRREIDKELINGGKKLRLIQSLRTDISNVDVEAAEAAGFPVATLRLLHWPGVAEHTLLLMLTLAKRLLPSHTAVISGKNPKKQKPERTSAQKIAYNWAEITGMTYLFGKTLGIIGLGSIGKEVAKRALAFEMKILYHQRHRLNEKEEKAMNVAYADLNQLLVTSDFVTIHVPHTFETEKMIGERELALMKPMAFLINTARGNIVDEVALYSALKEKRIAGAGLDVFGEEPTLPPNPLLDLDNIVLTPHTASGYDSLAISMEYYYPKYFENILRIARGEEPLDRIEP